jgi:hypothetical protein
MGYQDDISALLGTGQDPREQQLAQALRGQRAGGDMLGLSTIGSVSNLGQNINARTNAAAKQGGQLKQAMDKARLDREQRAETQSATNDYRNSMLRQSTERNALLEEDRIAKRELDIEKQAEIERKNLANEDINRKKANINSLKNNHVVNNLGGFLGQAAATIRANQLAGVETVLDPNAPSSSEKITQWAVENGADEDFTARLVKDVDDLNTIADMPLTDAVIAGGADALNWAKYQYSLTGRTGLVPYTQKQNKIPSGLDKRQDTISENLQALINQADAYDPSFASETIVPGANPVANWAATKYGTGTVDRKQNAAWHANLNQFYTMPIRNLYFGATLSLNEQISWEKSAINANMDDYQLRHAMATRLHIMRNQAEKQITSGLEAGYSMDVMKNKFGFLATNTAGNVNPDSPEGERLLRAGWFPGDDPADYPADAQENSEVRNSATTKITP